MINKLKIGLMALSMFSLMFMGAGNVNAAAGDVVWGAAQTVDLSSPDMDLTIASGSTASTFAVGTGTITPTLALGDVFTVATAAAGDFAVSPTTGAIITCSASNIATLVITAAGSQAYTVTPSTTACAYSSGGGGGGGGGGTVTPPVVTPPVVSTPALVAGCTGTTGYSTTSGASCKGTTTVATPSQTVIPGCGNKTTGFSTSTGVSCATNYVGSVNSSAMTTGVYNFGTTPLKNGSKGEAVKELQRFLNQVLNLGLVVDGKLGPKTIAVIKKWQKANGLVADGLIGAKTKAKMNASVQ